MAIRISKARLHHRIIFCFVDSFFEGFRALRVFDFARVGLAVFRFDVERVFVEGLAARDFTALFFGGFVATVSACFVISFAKLSSPNETKA